MDKPHSQSEQSVLDKVVSDFTAALKAGNRISIDEVVSAYPQHATQLRKELRRVAMLFQVHQADQTKRDLTAREISAPLQTVMELVSDTCGDEGEFSVADETYRLKVSCPECRSSIDVKADTPWTNLQCEACDAQFSLVGNEDDNETGLTHIGHFELIERVGLGAFGTVWRARDFELDREVAIKIPRKGLLNAEEAKLFLREAQAAAQIRHPNIVRVYEIGRFQGRVFIASEFIAGGSLSKLIAGERPTIRKAAEIVAKISDALQVAHEAGVVHRDLKPSNILVDRNGEPHVTDFGLAKRDSNDITMTRDGAIMGTPAYMSPEQAKGDAHTSDARSDIYSLGVILFRLLTGELPFRGTTQVLLQQVIHEESPSPRKFNPLVGRDLETICIKCLQKPPDARYQTAKELSEELGRFLEGLPIQSRPVGRITRVVRWCGRRKSLAAALFGMVFVSLIGTIVAFALTMRANRAIRNANANSLRAKQLQKRADLAQRRADRQMYAADMNRVQQAFENENRNAALEVLRDYLPPSTKSGLRGFEWHYWWKVNNLGAIDSLQVPRRVHCVTLSPNQEQIIWGDYDGNIGINSLDLGDPGNMLWNAHRSRVTDLCISPDGTRLVSCADDGQIRSWVWPTLVPEYESNVAGEPWHVSFLENGSELLVATQYKDELRVQIRETNSAQQLATFAIPGKYGSISISPDGKLLAISSYGKTGSVLVHDLSTHETVWSKSGSWHDDITFTPDSTRLVLSIDSVPIDPSNDKSDLQSIFEIVDAWTGQKIRSLPRRQGVLKFGDLLFDQDANLVTANGDGTIDIYAANSLAHVATLSGHENRVLDICQARNKMLISVSDDQSVRTWDLQDFSRDKVLRFPSRVSGVCFSRDDKHLLVSNKSQLQLFKCTRKTESTSVATSPFSSRFQLVPVDSATTLKGENVQSISPGRTLDEFTFVTVSQGDQPATSVWVYSIPNQRTQKLVTLDSGSCSTCQWTPENRLLIPEVFNSGWNMDLPAAVRIVQYAHGEYVTQAQLGGKTRFADSHRMSIADIAFDADFKRLVTCSRDRTIKLWDLEANSLLYSKFRQGNVNPITSVDVSSNDLVASGESNGRITIWSIDDANSDKSFNAHHDSISVLAFSPDGRSLFSASYDGKVKIWDPETKQLKTEFDFAGERITQLANSHDGHILIATDTSGNLYLLDGTPISNDRGSTNLN